MSEVLLNFSDETGLEAFEKQFNGVFPHLRLQLVRDKTLVKQKQSASSIQITEQTTVEQLESEFKNDFSIHATIFRLTGGSWIAVKQTRDWSLKDQNLEGGLV